MHVFDDNLRQFGRMLHYGGVLATVLSATLAYRLLHAPTVRAISETSTRIEEVMLSGQNAALIRDAHQKASSQLAQVERRIAAIEARVPDEPDAGDFLKSVTEIANEEQLSIKNFQPEKPTSRPGYAEMEVTLNGQGSFASICSFLDRLSRLSRLSKVKSLLVSAADDSNQYPMTATLIIYFGISSAAGERPEEAGRG